MLKLLVISLDRLRQTLKCRESRLVDVSNQKEPKWTLKNARLIPTKRLLTCFTKPEMAEVQSKLLFF